MPSPDGAGALGRILILGGYGGFGARLSRRLAARGHHVLVAGRSLAKAQAFCAATDGTEPLMADRDGDLAPILDRHRPDVLVDAAGPFQGSGYDVPAACLRAGVAYLDLADARDFVTGIAALDASATAAGVPIVTGASSVPALSGAVARHLAAGLDRVATVDLAISASNRATAGASVAAAILSYVGKPVRLWRHRHWTRGWGWQELRRVVFTTNGAPAIAGRWVALADVPDLDLLPEMLPGRPAVTFRAGTEIALQTVGLWLLSWPIRWLDLSAVPLAPLLLPLQRLTRPLTSDRSAMTVRLAGEDRRGLVERSWTLIADRGDGPEIPTLAAALIAEKMLAGTIPPGASDAGRLLALEEFAPLFATLAARQEVLETRLPPPLYVRVMGPAYATLPPAVRKMHMLCRDGGAAGEARVARGTNPLSRLIGRVMGFPPAGVHPLHVAFTERGGVETWTRRFGRHGFTSYLSQCGERLVERFGPLRFHFDLVADGQGLGMTMRRWSFLGMPLPLALAPRTPAREWQEGDRFRFDVPISLPLIGLIVHYDGWLEP